MACWKEKFACSGWLKAGRRASVACNCKACLALVVGMFALAEDSTVALLLLDVVRHDRTQGLHGLVSTL